jgi:peptidoglycan/LPS O-acetylase OafA/YrhL
MIHQGGWIGVLLFFVLSGFLITGILWDSFDDPQWWPKFVARRSLRIFPLYYLTLLIAFLAAIPAGIFANAIRHIWIPALFLENLPYLADLSNNIGPPFPLFHLWSIAVEEQFYLIWPWLLLLTRTRERAKLLCVATFLFSAGFRVVLARYDPSGAWDHVLPSEGGALAAGGWLALATRGSEFAAIRKFAAPAALLGLAGFFAVGFAEADFGRTALMKVVGMPCVTLFCVAMVALALEPGRIASLLSVGWLRWLGGISYGFYIVHMLFVKFYGDLAERIAGSPVGMKRNLVLFLVAGVCSTVIAWLSYHLFERQFLRLKRFFVPTRAVSRA